VSAEFEQPLFKQSVTSLSDLRRGAVVTGKVTNVTHFGAFVDIGVGQDGLIHSSRMNPTQMKGQRLTILLDVVFTLWAVWTSG
jgi:transcriptional accessory protein Tex/SPT6